MKTMSCSLLSCLCCAALLALNTSSASAQLPGNRDSLYALPLNEVRIGGYAGQKLDVCIQHTASVDENHLIAPFSARNETRLWQSEFWGKWFTAAVNTYRYTKDVSLKLKLDHAVQGLLATQTADGYIGNYAPDSHLKAWDIWGRKYCMLGLLAYHDLTQDHKTLSATKRLADHLIAEVYASNKSISEQGNFRGMAASSVLEPMVLLYNKTREQKYLDFAKYIVADWETPHGPALISKALNQVPVATRFNKPKDWFTWENGQKAYEMMSCYEGLLELYRVTGEEKYKLAVVQAVNNIRENEIMITGSGSSKECWYGGKEMQHIPAIHMMETCVTATWMKLCGQLLRLTGNAQYADDIERTQYNALYGSMTPDAKSWSKYSGMSGTRNLGEMQCGMNLNCCIASGPRGMMVLPQTAVMKTNEGVFFNTFSKMRANITLNSGIRLQVDESSNYPQNGEIQFKVNPSKPVHLALHLRVPQWSKNIVLKVNGMVQQISVQKGYAVLDRKWQKGDVLDMSLAMPVYVSYAKDNNAFAVQYGPLVLAADERLEHQQNYEFYKPQLDKNGAVSIEVLQSSDPAIFFMARVPVLKGPNLKEPAFITLCDFASAGNTWTNRSPYKTWLSSFYIPK